MTIRWLVAKYMPDQRRRETTNTGVILFDGDRAVAAKFWGERPDGTLDGRTIRWAREPAIYRGWIDYWRWLIDGDARLEEFTRRRSFDALFLEPGGELMSAETPDLDIFVSDLYQELVAPVSDEERNETRFTTLVSDLLERSGLRSREDFRTDYAVGAPWGEVRFPVALVNGQVRAVAKQTARLSSTWAQGALAELNITKAPVKVIITREPHLSEPTSEYLERYVRIVDVERDTASDVAAKFLATA